MLPQLQTTGSLLSRPARWGLAALAIVAIVSPLVYLSRTGAIMAEDGDTAIKPPVEEFLPPLSDSEKRITVELDKATTCDFVDMPLQHVVDYLQDLHSIGIQLDTKALEESGTGTDSPITGHYKGISLRSALRMLLGRYSLAYVIDDEVLQITSPEVADSRLFTRTYPVGDLNNGRDYDSLIEAITTSIHASSWDEVGGPGTISEMPAAGSLIISQTHDVHADVLQLLRSLRAAREAGGPALLKTLAAQAKEQAKKGRPGTGGLKGGMMGSAQTGGGTGGGGAPKGVVGGGNVAKPQPPDATDQKTK